MSLGVTDRQTDLQAVNVVDNFSSIVVLERVCNQTLLS